jgi:drug/metabolite transporter (DMT)-like permease
MLFGTVLLWALNITVTKYMFQHGWRPLAYGTIRYFVAIALFWGFTYYRERSFWIARRDLRFVLLAAAMIFLNQLCFVYGVKLAHASTVALLLGTTPIFIGLISLALRLEHLASEFWIGAAITFGGVALIALANGSVGSGLTGTLVAIATALTWACYTVSIAPLMRRYSPYRISALVLAIGWVPLALASIPQLREEQFSFGWKVWLGFGYAVVGPLFLTNILWFTSIDRVGRLPGVALREPAAVLRRHLRARAALGVAARARDRGRSPHLRRNRVRAALAPAVATCGAGARTLRAARDRRPRSGRAQVTSRRRASCR